MYLIKVFSQDRKTKLFVKASKLDDLIAEASKKLKLPDDSYQVFQENDGTLIDDDDVLQDLCDEAKTGQQKLCVMLLPAEVNWSPVDSSAGVTPVRSVSESSASSANSEDSSNLDQPPNSLSSSQCVTRGFPISSVSQFLDPLVELLNNCTHPPKHFPRLKKHAIKETFHAVGNHMILTLKDFSKPTARKLAQCVMDYGDKKYAKIFAVVIGENESDSGLSSFAQQIYAYVQANKGEDNVRKKGSRKRGHSGDDDPDDDLMPPPPSKQDSYGCVAFEPPLPEGETAESQEEKRVRASAAGPDADESTTLMRSTYASQRIEINRGKPMLANLTKILDRWPLLKHKVFLIKHAETLLGKDVSSVWSKCVSEKWKSMYEFLKSFWGTPLRKDPEEMLQIIEDSEKTDLAARAVAARCSSIFVLIAGFMGEAPSALLAIIHPLSSDEDVLEAAAESEGYPLVVIKGESLIDPNADFYIVLMGKIAVRVADSTEAMLVLLLSYYIFNLCYHPKLHSTLEFYQRFFLQVNPPQEQGNKRAKTKRTIDHIDAKVKNLAKKISDHTCLWSLPSS